MNVVEELKSLDVNDVGRWPLPFRVAVICIVFVAVVGMGVYWFIVQDKSPQLQRAQNRRFAFLSRTSRRRQQITIPTRRSWRRWSSPSALC